MLKVVFEDDSLLVIDKPPHLSVTSSETEKGETLEDILKSSFHINLERGGIIHRLDKDTSGLLVVAKTQSSLENLQAQFKQRVVKKTYLVLVHGWLKEKGEIKTLIGRNPGNREKFTVFESTDLPDEANVREAVTQYEPESFWQMAQKTIEEIFAGFNKIQIRKMETQHYGKFTLLACFPLTGRTHQIRVHLKYIGFPIVADDKYGGRKTVRLDRRFCPRQFLHATRLELNHPRSGERMKFESPLPDDLKTALAKLEKISHF